MQRYNRGERLYKAKQLKVKRKNYWGYFRVHGREGRRVMDGRQAGRVSQYPAMCSCPGCSGSALRSICGNGSGGKTVQELSRDEMYRLEMKGL